MSINILSTSARSEANAQESTTQTNISPEVSTTDGNYLTSTVLHNLINATKRAQDEPVVFHFGWPDYAFFVGLLGISTLIGVYYGFFSKHKQNNTAEYIFGGRSMKILPVATSLIASHVSGQTLVGLPTEVYEHGTQYAVFTIAAVLLGLALAYVFLPLYLRLGLTSTFEYLERRFNRRIRLLASFVFTVKCMLIIPVVIYVPALAFSQVTGCNVHFVSPVICIICVFYTTFGGLRAVIWTDFIQFILMVTAIITIVVLGTNQVGGFANVWSAAERGGRLILFNMNPSPFERGSFWTMSVGMTVFWFASSGVGQATVQKFLSVPDLKAGRRSVLIFVLGMIFIKFVAIYLGLCIYATYEHCDPIHTGVVSRPDEIVPYYLVQTGRKLPGIAGLFVAGIFAAGLATMSSILNTLAGTIYTDFVKECFNKKTEREASNMMKLIAINVGIVVTIFAFFVEKFGSVFRMGISISGCISGSFLSMFILGMTSRTANAKGLLVGVVTSCSLLTTILFGAIINGMAKEPSLPYQTDGCSSSLLESFEHVVNSTTHTSELQVEDAQKEVFWLFRISFMCYSTIGFVVAMVVGQAVSWLTGGAHQQIDENLLIPFFQSGKFKQRMTEKAYETKYVTIDQMLVEMTKIESKTGDENDPDDEQAKPYETKPIV